MSNAANSRIAAQQRASGVGARQLFPLPVRAPYADAGLSHAQLLLATLLVRLKVASWLIAQAYDMTCRAMPAPKCRTAVPGWLEWQSRAHDRRHPDLDSSCSPSCQKNQGTACGDIRSSLHRSIAPSCPLHRPRRALQRTSGRIAASLHLTLCYARREQPSIYI